MCSFGIVGAGVAIYWTMLVVMVLFWALIIYLVYRLLKRAGVIQHPEEKSRTNALKILDERFAKGEIGVKEYEERKNQLLK